jgi:hypothetical protein
VCALIAAALISLISMAPHAQHTGDKLQIAWRNSPLVCSYNERPAGPYQLIDESGLMMIVSVGGERVIDTPYHMQTHTFVSPRFFSISLPIYRKHVESFDSDRLRRSFIGEQSESVWVKGLPPDFIAFSLLYLNRSRSFPFAQHNQPRVLSYVDSWYSADVFYHKGHCEPGSISAKLSWLIADVNGDVYPGSVASGQYSSRNICACLGGSSRHPCYDQLPPHDAGLSVVDGPLSKIDTGDYASYQHCGNCRCTLSVRHPILFGIGVVLFALIGACGGMALGYLGISRLCAGRRWSGRLILGIGAVWFMIGAFDIPIARVFGLIN